MRLSVFELISYKKKKINFVKNTPVFPSSPVYYETLTSFQVILDLIFYQKSKLNIRVFVQLQKVMSDDGHRVTQNKIKKTPHSKTNTYIHSSTLNLLSQGGGILLGSPYVNISLK